MENKSRAEEEARDIASWWMGMRRCSKQMLAERITQALLTRDQRIKELKES